MTHPTGPADRAPLYHQIYLVLRARILDGTYPDRSLLPSENALTEMFGVSRITTRRALKELVAENLASREQGRGTRVSRPAARTQSEGTVEGLMENVLALGLRTTVEILAFGDRHAPPPIANALGLRAGEAVQEAVRVRFLDGVPMGYITTYVPSDIGALYDSGELRERPLLALLERKGVKASRAEQSLSAEPAAPDVAGRLEVAVGSALIRLERTVYDHKERAVEHIVALYRPDLYQYRTTLMRQEAGATRIWTPAA